jgi:hypothetical protein
MMIDIGKTLVAVGTGILFLGAMLWLAGGPLKSFSIGRLTTGLPFSLALTIVLLVGRFITSR